jgi:predicted dehydrogenase
MTVKIALVGLGGYGGFYLNQMLFAGQGHDFRLVGAVDPQPERCAQLDDLRQAGVPLFSSLEAFYERESADLVVLASPIHLHSEQTCLALAHGAHVLCEKPTAGSLADALTMQQAERRSGQRVAIGFQWSFSNAVQSLKRDIQAGRFGRPVRFSSLVLWPRRRSYYQRSPWAGRVRMPGLDGAWVLDSPAQNAAAHYLHNLLFLLGDAPDSSARPVSLQAELYRANPIENFDTCGLRVQVESGVEVNFLAAHPVLENIGPLVRCELEDAVVEYPDPEGGFSACFRDGRAVQYGNPQLEEANKLWQMAALTASGGTVACGIHTALPHLICIAGAGAVPIQAFPPELVRYDDPDGDVLTWAAGLGEVLSAGFAANRLPFETGAPWAAAGQVVDLRELTRACFGPG